MKGTAQGGAFFVGTPSGLVTTSASADILDLNGTNPAGVLEYNTIQDLLLMRSVAPTGTATGLSLNFVAGPIVENVQIMDSARGMYLHYVPSRGSGRIENNTVSWGYGSVTGYTGTLSGYYLDSADGNAMFSFRARHNLAASGLAAGSGTHGMDVQGITVQDIMIYGFESAATDYGIYLKYTGAGTLGTNSDLHFYGSILDTCQTSCIYVQGFTASGYASVEFNGGWAGSNASTTKGIDIESSSGVTVSNMQIGGTYTNQVYVSGSSNINIQGNNFFHVASNGVTLNSTTGSSVVGNTFLGASAASMIALTTGTYNNLTGNTFSGTGTVGISFDSNSNNNTGYSTNTVGSGITSSVTNTGQLWYEKVVASDAAGAPGIMIANTNSAGYPALGFQNNTGGASAQGAILLGGTTIAAPFTNTLWMYNSVGGLYLRGNGPITINANTTATPAITDLGVANTHLVQAGYGFQSTGTKFTTSGCSISSTTGGGTAGTFTLGANTCTAVLTMNGATGATATNGWSCQAHDRTAPTILIGGETSSTTTTASIAIPAGAGATDVISFSCTAF
jgi:hypothetical protein